MGYRFRFDETVEAGLKRIAREQIDRGLEELSDPELDRHEAIHQVRKRCKKLRGLLRLVRPAFKQHYQVENAWYRDAARELACIRDTQSSLEAYLKLVERERHQLPRHSAERIADWLSDRRDAALANEDEFEVAVDRFRDRMVKGRHRIARWTLAADGFDALASGFARTYGRGRGAMARAYASADSVDFHNWRKRVKYHWYQLRLLQPLHPQAIKTQQRQADRLGELLGEEHDLAVLRELLASSDDGPGEAELMLLLIARRLTQLRSKAARPGALLYCEKPKCLLARFRCYWALRAE